MRAPRPVAVTAALTMLLGTAYDVRADEIYEDLVMYGIDSSTGQFWRHDFTEAQEQAIGHVHDPDTGEAYTGIYGSAHVPGHVNIFAFQWDENDHQARMLWVNVDKAAQGKVTGAYDIEGGPIGGATAHQGEDGEWIIYGVQHEMQQPPQALEGTAQLNPNAREDMYVKIVTAAGETYTQDDLLSAGQDDLDDKYLLENEKVERFEIRPMGAGNQNSLVFGGEELELENSNKYVFVGDMNISVHNERLRDNPESNTMGHWELEVDGEVTLNDAEVVSPHRLVRITRREETVIDEDGQEHTYAPGRVRQLGGELQRGYDALATMDGTRFYATRGHELWQITVETEASVKEEYMSTISNSASPVSGMTQNPRSMFGYRLNADEFGYVWVNPTDKNANMEETIPFYQITNLGTIVITSVETDRSERALTGFD